MGILSKFENRMEDGIEGGGTRSAGASLTATKIVKLAVKEMRRQKQDSAGRSVAPTLYTVLVSPIDQDTMFGSYHGLAEEAESLLRARAREYSLSIEGKPLVRFIADPELKKGKFDVVAEAVPSNVLEALRHDELVKYGLATDESIMVATKQGRRQAASDNPRSSAKPAYSVEDAVAAAEYAVQYAEHYSVGASNELSGGGGLGLDSLFSNENKSTRQTSLPVRGCLHDKEHGKTYNLSGSNQTIGRESSNNITVPDINISRRHAQISCDVSGVWKIVDLGSTNGVAVNGVKVESATLKDQDVITLGTTKLQFEIRD